MDAFLLKLILGLLAIISIPIIISYFGYKLLTKTRLRKFAFVFPIIIIGAFIYIVFRGFYPEDSFFKEEFERNSGINFPSSGDIIEKEATYPDFHGDYQAYAIMEVDENEYWKLESKFLKSPLFKVYSKNQDIRFTLNFRDLTNTYNENETEIAFYYNQGIWFKVTFLKDRKRIIFERSSS